MKNSILGKARWLLVAALATVLTTNAWGADPTTVSVNIGTYATANSWVNESQYASVSVDANVTVSGLTNDNNGKYCSSNSSWRHYESNSGTITVATTSGTLSSVTFTYSKSNNGVIKKGSTNVTSGNACSISGTSVTFNVNHSSGKKSGNVQITEISVTYTPAASCTSVPTVSAASNGSVTSSSATVSCASGISSLGSTGCTISSYGFVIGGSANPSIGGSGVTQHEVGDTYTTTGESFSKNLTGLTASTTYYVRPYATNGKGTGYGSQTSFTTSAPTPTLSVDPSSLNFGDVANGGSKSLTFTLTGIYLTANASVGVTGTGYSVSPTSVTKDGSGNISQTVTVTYAPTSVGDGQTGTVTITSSGASNQTVSLTGNSKATYTVTCSAASNGSVTSDKASAMAGETVTLTITPNSGYQLSTISANNGAVTLSGTGNTRTFTMPTGNVTVTSTFVAQTDYALVTNVSDLNDGDLITLCTVTGNSTAGYILDAQNSNNRARKSITTGADGKIAQSDVAYPIVLESVTGGWKLKDQTNSNYYLYATYNQNYLKNAEDPTNSVWTIAINTTTYVATITTEAYSGANHDTRSIQYNGSSSIFSAYKNSQADCYIYKKELGCDKLAAPTGLSVTNKATTTCTLNWNSVTDASGYEVSLDNGSTWTSNGSNTTYNVTAGAGWTAGSEHTWKVRATGDGDTYCAKGNAASSTVTMKNAVTVTYHSNGATGGQLPVAGGVVNLTEGDSYTVLGNTGSGGSPTPLTKSGYTWAGWHSSTTYSATPAYTVGGSITVNSSITLYANWAPKRDTYIDGVHSTADQYGDGANYTVPSCSDQSRATSGACDVTHYKFIGWALENADLTDPANIFKGGTKTATGATYYAVWGEEL